MVTLQQVLTFGQLPLDHRSRGITQKLPGSPRAASPNRIPEATFSTKQPNAEGKSAAASACQQTKDRSLPLFLPILSFLKGIGFPAKCRNIVGRVPRPLDSGGGELQS